MYNHLWTPVLARAYKPFADGIVATGSANVATGHALEPVEVITIVKRMAMMLTTAPALATRKRH
eukprot:4010144-Amphidinium_carterae.1